MSNICTEIDGWQQNYAEMNTVWIVELNDGTIVYQDDERPGTEDSAWERLGKHCAENHLYIKSMKLKFRSNEVFVAGNDPNIKGFFFCKSVLGMMVGGSNYHFYIAGTLKDDILVVVKWAVPTLQAVWSEHRNPDNAGICLIRKPDDKVSI